MKKSECYQRKLKYRHFVKTFPDGKRVLLLGADVNASPNDIDLYVENLDFYDMYMQLSVDNQGLVDGVIARLMEEEYHSGDYDVRNFDIIADFVAQRYDRTVTKTAEEIANRGTDEFLKTSEEKRLKSLFEKSRLDNAKHKRCTIDIKTYCAYYMISWEALFSGKGTMYNMREEVYSDEYAEKIDNLYTYEKIRSLIEEDANISTKDIITKITGLSEDELLETPVRIFKFLSPEREMAVLILVEELLKRQ